jgi:hypothetical protein
LASHPDIEAAEVVSNKKRKDLSPRVSKHDLLKPVKDKKKKAKTLDVDATNEAVINVDNMENPKK